LWHEGNESVPTFPTPPFNKSLEEEENFALFKKSVSSFEFHTNNARTTVTTLNQLEAYYMDLEEVNSPSNNQNHGH